MSFTPASFGFDLNNREVATLIYFVMLLAFVLAWKKGRSLAFNIVCAFFAKRLVLVWLLMTLYVAACVWFLAWLNVWDWPNLKSTMLWWVTVGFTCIYEAKRLQGKQHMRRQLISEAFKVSAVVLFIAELVSFPLWAELLMLPALVFLALLVAHKESQTDTAEGLKQLRALQVFAGILLLGYSYWLVIGNVTALFSLNTLREFGLPILLWLMFIPFVVFLSVYMSYEEIFIRLKVRPKQAPVVQYARLSALFSFGWNIDAVGRLARDMHKRDIDNKQEIKKAIREIKQLLKVERNPPSVVSAEGWSPYAARVFLEEYALVTNDYHREQWGWCAHTPSVKLNARVLTDRVSYRITGNEHAVTQLRIELDGSNQNDTKEAQYAFDEYALTLLTKTFGSERASEIYACAQASEPDALMVDGIRVSLARSAWGDVLLGGYEREFVIQHPKHQGVI